MITIIVAIDARNAIGREGTMPWHLSADLKHFKAHTIGQTVVMGANTWRSIGERALPGRRNIVVSSSLTEAPGAEVVRSIDEALGCAASGDVFIIGGAQIYRQTIAIADRLIVTHINKIFECTDTFFPEIDDAWQVESRSGATLDERSGLEYEFITYSRVK